jgi:glutamate-1-semialdehyde 2,1-aminomutase
MPSQVDNNASNLPITALPRIDAALQAAQQRYALANPRSAEQHIKAAEVLPGGNTRSVLYSTPFPLTLVRGHEATVTSLDDITYRDFLGEFTAGLYGHSDPTLREAIAQALDNGWVMGGHVRAEETLARLLTERFTSMQRLRFTNSGTEANLYAISAARALTKRRKVVVFDGAYHGGVFLFAGGKPSELTVPMDFVIAPYNDIAGTRAVLDLHGGEIGTVVVEQMQGSAGCIPANHDFLRALREWTSAHGALLLFDEVMTSRLSPGGLQALTGVTPDLTSVGKYIGGGFSFGAFGGRADLMDRFNPARADAFAHAGTFNNNAFTMTVGAAGLAKVYTPKAAVSLNGRGDVLRERLNQHAARAHFPMQFTGLGSMMNVHMCPGQIQSVRDLTRSIQLLRELFYFDLLEQGIWIARRGMINLSMPMTDADIDALADAVGNFVERCNAVIAG